VRCVERGTIIHDGLGMRNARIEDGTICGEPDADEDAFRPLALQFCA
jgi:hypothetical protein